MPPTVRSTFCPTAQLYPPFLFVLYFLHGHLWYSRPLVCKFFFYMCVSFVFATCVRIYVYNFVWKYACTYIWMYIYICMYLFFKYTQAFLCAYTCSQNKRYTHDFFLKNLAHQRPRVSEMPVKKIPNKKNGGYSCAVRQNVLRTVGGIPEEEKENGNICRNPLI